MGTRMDHTNCTHPRTPAGRAACRKAGTPVATPSAPLTREQLTDGMTTKEKASFARQMANDADRAAGRLAKRGRTTKTTTVEDVCTCGGNPETDGKVFIHSHKCPMKGKQDNVIVHNKDLPMPKLTPAQLASPTFRSMLRKREI